MGDSRNTSGGIVLLQGICSVLVTWVGQEVRSCSFLMMDAVLVGLFGGNLRALVWRGVEWRCCG